MAEVKVMMGQELRRQSSRIRDPELNLGIGISEPLRKHAHHRVWLPIEMDLSSDNRRISAESPLEEIPPKHDSASIRTIFALGEGSPDGCVHPQQRKQVPASTARAHQFRQLPFLSCQIGLPIAP